MKKHFVFILLTLAVIGKAQNKEHISSFNMLSITYKFSKKWMAYTEFQTRSIEDYTNIDYYETKGGVGYNINRDNQAFVGVGRYGTYKEQKISQEELRLWLQYTYSHNIGRVNIDHRGRAEQRFFHMSQTGENTTDNRFRYRLSATMPINNPKMQANTFFVNAFEELFVGPKSDFLKRNRLFTGFGYKFNKSVSTSMGYMWQREFSPNGNKNLHFLYMVLNFTIDHSDDDHARVIIPVAD
ncbi:DUF2490 domain-containing protein [Elizabethkingia miricola]|uniref:DUF2490 domain-containing protein n=1 Tax=Elizabethkingia miricola TaxID=172045 RepID=UPI00140AC76E|nr:DUF2490 domain-containing protein [Elizabethkingia miricola]NHQ66638.1 DUF2490 domain-containing protein [Elizabethkingia miricola]NHQ70399.1 DUF2490 domain-containing protein [Elizabethkingia miricola]NHQ76994.1 DUF2490 domain-containing protein [Elizabethkingia miricola]